LLLAARRARAEGASAANSRPTAASISGDPVGCLAALADAEGDVAPDRQVREQREVLEHHADAAPLGRHVAPAGAAHDAAVDCDAAGSDALESADAAQGRRLAQPDGPSRQQRSPLASVRSKSENVGVAS
jgi:hypothetical protein